jgi:hypothetical protein
MGSIIHTAKTSFCSSCEFAGTIPAGSSPIWSASRRDHDNVNSTVLFDQELHGSTGIVNLQDTQHAPRRDTILLALSKKCAGVCALAAAGYVPIELGAESRKAAMEGLLNSMPGITELGKVEFIDEDYGSEDITHVTNSDTGAVIN